MARVMGIIMENSVEHIMKVSQGKQEPLLLVRKMCQQLKASRGPAEQREAMLE